jgi:hypothetical protein
MRPPVYYSIVTSIALAACATAEEQAELPFPSPSSFISANVTRDPFVSMDQTDLARQEVMVASMPGGTDVKTLFNVTTISISRLSLAVINRHAFVEGETFELKKDGGDPVRVHILRIRDGAVELEFEGRKISVPLSRPKFKLFED